MMTSVRNVLRTLALLSLQGVSHATSDCNSGYIQTQGDADGLSACETIYGSVVIAKSFHGDLTLPGMKSIQGNLSTEPCESDWPSSYSDWQTDPPHLSNWTSRNCSGLTHLIAPDLHQVSQNISLIAQLNLSEVNFPKLIWVGTTFSLDGMPSLVSVEVPILIGFERFNLFYTPLLQNLKVPSSQADEVGAVTVAVTGWDDPSSVFAWARDYQSIALTGLLNATAMEMNLTGHVGSLDISGNGLLAVQSNNHGTVVDSLLSGVGDFMVPDWAIETISAVGNTFNRLDLSQVEKTQNLYVRDNVLLEKLFLRPAQNWTNVAITGNSVLDPGSTEGRFDITTFLGTCCGDDSADEFPPASSLQFEGGFGTAFL
ncbi:hypothetical protein BJ170DRAFT_315798 [Xylariales sp. AK1849]|nr:hypothetical protein BJ170DRAFT_315798 [Xylariales sp. AK1849]